MKCRRPVRPRLAHRPRAASLRQVNPLRARHPSASLTPASLWVASLWVASLRVPDLRAVSQLDPHPPRSLAVRRRRALASDQLRNPVPPRIPARHRIPERHRTPERHRIRVPRRIRELLARRPIPDQLAVPPWDRS